MRKFAPSIFILSCAARMDKEREVCGYSLTIEETWIKEELA
jgi:hypothetical protein